MASEGWFRKRPAAPANIVPDGVAIKCVNCAQILFTRDFEKNLKVCPQCGFHHKLTATERIEYTVDEGSFKPIAGDLTSIDVLGFPDYPAKLDKGRTTTGLSDGMQVGTARIRKVPVVFGTTDFFFMGGTMGSVFGEKIVRAVDTSIRERLPLVLFTSSGGARMQEGLVALMQMGKTSSAVAVLAEHKLPYIAIITDPTTGGVMASYASLADIILAEPKALMGFAGARVAAQASVQKPPPDYQTAEWQQSRGQVDLVVPRRDIPDVIASLLLKLGCREAAEAEPPLDMTLGRMEGAAVGN